MTPGRTPVRDLIAAVERTIDARGLLKGGERIVVAVSGGADSTTLLHVLHRLAPARALELHVAHLDHRLRPGSDRDAAAVARAAGRLGLPVTLRAAPIPARAGLSPEEAAREVRLAFLEELADSIAADAIATGHTLDDRAETVLMRLLLGTGPRGLAGIRPRRAPYVRPLIDVRRAQTEAFCRALRLRPRRDPTNDDPSFLRNAIRAETIPTLERSVNARLSEALARLADVMESEDEAMTGVLADAIQAEVDDREVRLPLDTLGSLPVALQRRAIRDAAARAGSSIGFEHTEAVRALALEGRDGATVSLPGPLNARRGYGFLVIGRVLPPASAASPVELLVPGETDLPPWRARMRTWMTAEGPASWPDGRDGCVVDADQVTLPLRVRAPRDGDRFRPLGMRGSKKLGDLFTDVKVPRERRAAVPVVADACDRIVWVAGHRIDDRVKVDDRTRRFLWFRLSQEA